MILALVKDVENWSLDDLIAYAKQRYQYVLREMSDEALQSEYNLFIALTEEEQQPVMYVTKEMSNEEIEDRINQYFNGVEQSHEADELLDERR